MSPKKNNEKSAEPEGDEKKKKDKKKGDGTRETVESIAIAFILAFLFKTFQAEAYVIPTGSMAPTLFGRHKEVTCEGCGFEFALGASSELDQETGLLEWRIKRAFCSNCGLLNEVRDAPVFNGDRILVNKQVSEFDRFDVVVFKNPEQGHVNYIKRLVGKPNETVRIRKGDLWVKLPGAETFEIQRKKPDVQRDIQLVVYDDRYPPAALIEAGWPERWVPSAPAADSDEAVGGWAPTENGWTADREARSYQCDASDSAIHFLRYRHFQPSQETWNEAEFGELRDIKAELISDFCSFNAYDPGFPGNTYWVGDLTLNADVDVQTVSDDSRLTLELVDGPLVFYCTIELATGVARLSSGSTTDTSPPTPFAQGQTDMAGTGTWEVSFANVDDRLCLWVDGSVVEFDESPEYESSVLPQPTSRDLTPIAIGVASASVSVSNLLIERDIYYRNDIIAFDHNEGVNLIPTYASSIQHDEIPHRYKLESQLHNPEAWARIYAEESAIQLAKYGKYGEYQLNDDEYLMFGDNSSMSKDSRLFDYLARPMNGVFSHRYAVRRKDLIGKALFIFWPHGVPFLNDGKGIPVKFHSGRKTEDPDEYPSWRIPFYPNVGRMKKIR